MAKLSFGSCYFSTTALTSLSANTPAKAAGTTTAMQLGDFTTTNNRLTYTGATTRTFQVGFAGTSSKGGGGSTLGIYSIYKNGSAIPGILATRTIANATDRGAFGMLGQIQLAQNEYIELWLETDTGDDLTIEAGVLSAVVIG